MIRVLLVDDDADHRLLTRHALRAGPVEFEVVDEAADGLAAIESAADHQPDLVLLDLDMPRLGGLEALPRIRLASPGSRIVVVSAFDRRQAEPAARGSGAVAYIEKGSFSPLRLGEDLLALGSLLDVTDEALQGLHGRFDPEPVSARRARRFVGAALRRWQCGQMLDDVGLMVSELVTNALRHARSEADVSVRLVDGRIRVEVSDHSGDMPTVRHPGHEELSGRGLLMVESLADSWGVEARGDGKLIWFEMPTPSVAASFGS